MYEVCRGGQQALLYLGVPRPEVGCQPSVREASALPHQPYLTRDVRSRPGRDRPAADATLAAIITIGERLAAQDGCESRHPGRCVLMDQTELDAFLAAISERDVQMVGPFQPSMTNPKPPATRPGRGALDTAQQGGTRAWRGSSPGGLGAVAEGGAPGARVLVVGEQPRMCRLLADTLSRIGLEVWEARPPEVDRLLDRARPSLLLLDVQFPSDGTLRCAVAYDETPLPPASRSQPW